MTPGSVQSVGERIGAIQARFRPAPGFQAALQHAQGAAGSAGDGATDVAGARRVEARPLPAASGATAGTGAPAASQGTRAPQAGGGDWVGRLPDAGREWAPAIERAALAAGIEPELLAAVVQAESGFRPQVVSHAGAIGLAQLMPQTAAYLGVDPHNPEENLAGGARYLREQLDRFGAVDLALAAYNAGPNRVAQAGGIPQITETQNYVVNVRDHYTNLR